jgi:hypothetical protein
MNTTLATIDFTTFVYDPVAGDFVSQENDGTKADVRVCSAGETQYSYIQAAAPVYHAVA